MTEYAFILTGHWIPPKEDSPRIFTLDGQFKATPGMTRQAALADIMATARKRNGIDEDTFVGILFFSLEPNLLGGAR